MKLLMVTPYFFPRVGGVEKHVLRVSEELAARGHRVDVLTLLHDTSLAREERIGGLSVWRLPRKEIWRAYRLRWRLAGEADLVHCHDPYALLRFLLDYRLTHPRKPFFITSHGYEGYPIPREARRARRLAWRLTRGRVCMGAFIQPWYGTRCDLVCYGGVDSPAKEGLTPLPPPRALFVGRLEADTGILGYVEALRLLRDKHGIFMPLEVCGRGSLQEKAESLADEFTLSVRFRGEVADFSPLLAEASALFASGYLTMWEGMAARRPVYALYDNPLKRDYLACFPGVGRGLTYCGSAEELADRLAYDIAHAEILEQRITAGRELAERNTWGAVADLYLRLYREYGKD